MSSQLTSMSSRLRQRRSKSSYRAINGMNDHEMSNILRENTYTVNHLNDGNNGAYNRNQTNYQNDYQNSFQNDYQNNYQNNFTSQANHQSLPNTPFPNRYSTSRSRANTAGDVYVFNQYFLAQNSTHFQRSRSATVEFLPVTDGQ